MLSPFLSKLTFEYTQTPEQIKKINQYDKKVIKPQKTKRITNKTWKMLHFCHLLLGMGCCGGFLFVI